MEWETHGEEGWKDDKIGVFWGLKLVPTHGSFI